jgi:hypothetical protein
MALYCNNNCLSIPHFSAIAFQFGRWTLQLSSQFFLTPQVPIKMVLNKISRFHFNSLPYPEKAIPHSAAIQNFQTVGPKDHQTFSHFSNEKN